MEFRLQEALRNTFHVLVHQSGQLPCDLAIHLFSFVRVLCEWFTSAKCIGVLENIDEAREFCGFVLEIWLLGQFSNKKRIVWGRRGRERVGIYDLLQAIQKNLEMLRP